MPRSPPKSGKPDFFTSGQLGPKFRNIELYKGGWYTRSKKKEGMSAYEIRYFSGFLRRHYAHFLQHPRYHAIEHRG